MAKVSTNISIDADIKAQAQELFSDLGIDLSTAVNIFLRQSIRENAIPFSVSRDVPNAETVAAMKEAEDFKRNPQSYKSYGSFSEMFDEVMTDA
ncbi:MAG: type II toxin-antitoxin system RelB/DinJ family antitoxin [Acutalibacteraceae bacterium]|nr:type II toxin-antitoxin system RelB/DinJ family antitoxin [Acutalibacteraceae bacterium]